MSHWFQNLPIRRKLALLILITGCIALVLASTALWIFKTIDLRATTVTEISTLAEAIGSNTTAALTFQDRRAAEETLAALRADKRILLAVVFAKDGSPFARYVQRGVSAGSGQLRPVGHYFEGGTCCWCVPSFWRARPSAPSWCARACGAPTRTWSAMWVSSCW